MRCALYARYSDDVQNPRSIADQLDVLTKHATAKGWVIVGAFTDAAISGAAMANRPGFLAAVDAAERGEFDVLLAEDEDRLARNLEHLAHAFNRLTWRGVVIATLTKDAIGLMDVALKGLMGQDYLVNLSAKTKRGMHSNAEKGLATGSRVYGYKSQPGGAMAIVADEAEIINRIFGLYADDGLTTREIADRLNTEGTPGPRGGPWNASSIHGSRQRANGVLRTDLYSGVKVWNRMDVRKDPRTGRRLPRTKPEAEWRRTPVPDLAIVPADLWARVASRIGVEAAIGPRKLGAQRRGTLLAGLVKCGLCGASYTSYGHGLLVCASNREKGPSICPNGRKVRRDEVERRTLEGLQTRLLTPEAVRLYVRQYHADRVADDRARQDQRAPLEKRLGVLKRSIQRGVDAVFDGSATRAERERLHALEAEQDAIEAELLVQAQATAYAPVALHPRIAEAYAAQVGRLQDVLADIALQTVGIADPDVRELFDAVRGLVDKITLTPASLERGSPIAMTLHGRLALFMDESAAGRGRGGKLVAGASYTLDPPIIRVAIDLTLRAA